MSAARPNATERLVEQLLRGAFHAERTQRSPEYRAGAEAALRQHAGLNGHIPCPHQPGTAAFDAYWAGTSEGNVIWWRHREEATS